MSAPAGEPLLFIIFCDNSLEGSPQKFIKFTWQLQKNDIIICEKSLLEIASNNNLEALKSLSIYSSHRLTFSAIFHSATKHARSEPDHHLISIHPSACVNSLQTWAHDSPASRHLKQDFYWATANQSVGHGWGKAIEHIRCWNLEGESSRALCRMENSCCPYAPVQSLTIIPFPFRTNRSMSLMSILKSIFGIIWLFLSFVTSRPVSEGNFDSQSQGTKSCSVN